ncbi:hypothetical protein GW793_01565 [bacterium]|uniref:Bacterial Ig-like domain-containing protein n=2 Tax=Katanobacteria TaxID=422282 RepID=A0A2M7X1K9_UNCKA|nr:hypothetical protein [bacterium]PIP56154.1 MAG: hypothetical protein COX05_04450 [candidate division WWE3 bacterium CG22_combo_CG10-13_8_21_14_all_39_12]PJA40054.1 MAG: hypothetical protein CO179_03430 [candidate division WWE3 bacterium CG_4_9_14_3_um_filter_39_7]
MATNRQFRRRQTNNVRTSYTYKPGDAIRDDEKAVYRNLIVVFIIVIGLSGILYLWGIDIVVKLSDFWRDILPSQNIAVIDNTDSTLELSAPRLDPLPLYVNEPTIDIKGWAQPGLDVEIFINDISKASVLVDKNGRFEYTANDLSGGENIVYAVAVKGDTRSPDSNTASVTNDTTKPIIQIDSYDATTEPPYTALIVGSVTEKSTITINDQRVILQADNTFNHSQTLVPGENTITVKAIDLAGNEAKQDLTITIDAVEATPQAEPAP